MLTFLTIKSYFALAIVTLALHGLGFSFVYATAISAAQKWFPRSRRGLVGSLVLSGYGYGSLIWVPIQTAFVNPGNSDRHQIQSSSWACSDDCKITIFRQRQGRARPSL